MSRRRTRRPQPTTDTRSPDERLEALAREPNPDRARRMMLRIRGGLDETLAPGPWIAAARVLSERLIISENTFYYFAELFTECMFFSESQSDPELSRIRSEMEDIERAHGLTEDESWYVDDAPPEWRALNDAWERRADAVVALHLRQFGHADVASLLEQNRAEFDRRAKEGRVQLWGEDEELDDLDPSS